ncbi:DUF1579 domain-containing protein [Sorangium sp. So ce327]|uniref:DUF1579 domain-containing protein n=1 Tax=unclassified Sorangium TaxID=2621164 RepID=UPI003F600AF4
MTTTTGSQNVHPWLEQLVGEWTSEFEAPAEPGKPPQTFTGTEIVRSLGGVWVVCEGRFETPGGVGINLMTLGYDPQKNKFIGTFVGAMMTHLWVYEGSLDASERVLRLDTEGPGMEPGAGLTKYVDSIELKSDDHRVLTSRMLGPDGAWQEVMTMNYRRKK